MPRYLNVNIDGLIVCEAIGDGYGIKLSWSKAYQSVKNNKILYNIYIGIGPAPAFTSDFFNYSPAFVSIDKSTSATILDLSPGQMYWFSVRAAEYNPSIFNPASLPIAYNNLRVYPQSLLSSNISAISSLIPLVDATGFPTTGTVKIGGELINYSSISINNLVLTNASLQRGYNGSISSMHNTDGYDGYVFWDPNAIFWPVEDEEQNTRVFECWNRFDVDNFPYTVQDGYRQTVKDILTTDLTVSDAANINFPAYDFSGYHRTDPVLLYSGVCVGSYIGGQVGCVDGYSGVGMQLRGLNIQDVNQQRQEVLLSLTGEPVVLVRRRWTGVTCQCMLPYNEYPEARCQKCLGTGIIVGWTQFFDPRRSDGRIMVRVDPTVDDLVPTDSGLESQMSPTCWTGGWVSLKDRDFIVRFDQNGNEEFRYEILNVTRNKMLFGLTGVEKFAAQRIRKTDSIYQVPIFPDSSKMPRIIMTSFNASAGFPSHQHSIVISENITSINQINEITSVAQGHSHIVENGVILDLPPGKTIGHTHTISII